MSDQRLYLVTPPAFEPAAFASLLAEALEAGPVECVELRLASGDEAGWRTAIEALRPVAQDRNAAFLLTDRAALAAETGCDGVALLSPQSYAEARRLVGPQAIVGAWAGTSRHDAMTAGERGADFVGFAADAELIDWWADLFEIPCVAYGGITPETGPAFGKADFLALDDAVWGNSAGPAEGVRAFL
ncbi:thiamine phosphate synthase [Inquilinus sp. CAU 1745]|uniref:thiamine phosphate synthase n=1 Tax=Inquilinus sp. CAU 1745 TaxID=3140369 RepID=UPI00325A5F7E